MVDLVYCSTPARLLHLKNHIKRFVSERNGVPFHPFDAFPYEYFEGKFGRDIVKPFYLRGVEFCDRFSLFGVSDGSLRELSYAIEIGKPIELHHKKFDENTWERFYDELGAKYNNPLGRVGTLLVS